LVILIVEFYECCEIRGTGVANHSSVSIIQGGPKVSIQYIVYSILYTYFWPILYKQNKKLHGLKKRYTYSFQNRCMISINSSSFRFKRPAPQVQEFNIFPLLSPVMVFDDARDRLTFSCCVTFTTLSPQ